MHGEQLSTGHFFRQHKSWIIAGTLDSKGVQPLNGMEDGAVDGIWFRREIIIVPPLPAVFQQGFHGSRTEPKHGAKRCYRGFDGTHGDIDSQSVRQGLGVVKVHGPLISHHGEHHTMNWRGRGGDAQIGIVMEHANHALTEVGTPQGVGKAFD